MLGTFAGSNLTSGDYNIIIGNDAQPSSNTVNGEITIGDTNVTSLRLPGLQSGASDGDVLTFSSGTGLITLQSGGGGGASDLNGLSDCLVTAQLSQYIGNVPGSVTSGSAFNNTSLGHDTLENLTGGGNNTMLGFEAGYTITTNNDNTVIGSQALRSSNPAKVVAVGRFAGNASSGNNTVLVGYQAGRVNTNSGHVSVGYQAGYSQTSGTSNTNLGYQAGMDNTSGTARTCIGHSAGKDNTGGYNTLLDRDWET
jgi:hypothetical protein